LEEAGLDPVRVELIQKDMTHKGREGLLGWIRTTWHPFLDRVPDDLRQVFLEEAVDLYLVGHPLGKDGVAHVSAVRLEVEAVKK
jgi:trans-aconitate methyltransferase